MTATMTVADRIDNLRKQAADLWAARCFAYERENATLNAYLTGRGTEARFLSWANKRSDLGIAYYETMDEIAELEESL